MAKPRRASDNHLEKLQQLADILAMMATDSELDGDMSGDEAVASLGVLIPWARTLSDARPAQIGALVQGSPIAQARETMALATQAEVLGIRVVIDPTMRDGEAALVTENDRYRFTVEGFVHPCKPCGGTGEIIEYPPDDDERMVSCPACGGTGEAITL